MPYNLKPLFIESMQRNMLSYSETSILASFTSAVVLMSFL